MLVNGAPNFSDLAEALDDIVQANGRAGEVISRVRRLLKKGENRFEPVDVNELFRSTLKLPAQRADRTPDQDSPDLVEHVPLALGDRSSCSRSC